jgi:hypothetical protein
MKNVTTVLADNSTKNDLLAVTSQNTKIAMNKRECNL